jgi:hypothetical protein
MPHSSRVTLVTHLAVVAVGQQAHQTRLPQPLGLARAEELVKDDLRDMCDAWGVREAAGAAVSVWTPPPHTHTHSRQLSGGGGAADVASFVCQLAT